MAYKDTPQMFCFADVNSAEWLPNILQQKPKTSSLEHFTINQPCQHTTIETPFAWFSESSCEWFASTLVDIMLRYPRLHTECKDLRLA